MRTEKSILYTHRLCSVRITDEFAWGKDAAEAVHNAVVLEEVAKMARLTESVNPEVKPAPDNIKEKHFYRKHGANAYYGQN